MYFNVIANSIKLRKFLTIERTKRKTNGIEISTKNCGILKKNPSEHIYGNNNILKWKELIWLCLLFGLVLKSPIQLRTRMWAHTKFSRSLKFIEFENTNTQYQSKETHTVMPFGEKIDKNETRIAFIRLARIWFDVKSFVFTRNLTAFVWCFQLTWCQ